MMDFATFLDASRAILPTLNLPIKNHLHQGSCVFSDVILMSNYHSYKEKTIKLLPHHSFYGGHVPPQKIECPFLAVHFKKIQSHQDGHLAAFP